jgi:asparagine synthase (glutamine-hydrolysing)
MQKYNNITTVFAERAGFPWYGDDRCRVRGSFFDGAGTFYSGDAMAGYFSAAGSFAAFKSLAAGANGVFSVIRMLPEECWLATDLVRSLPLFYCRSATGWVVTDHADLLREYLIDSALNEDARLEFRGTGYVTGNETLVTGIFQVQAGEVLRLGEKAEQGFHHTYRTCKGLVNSSLKDLAHTAVNDLANRTGDVPGKYTGGQEVAYDALKHAAGEHMERAFSRMIRSLEGRTAVVPLSGGFDSRLIAVMLKRHGYTNVVCFTYGRKGNVEAALSERVARALDFPWYFVEYNQQLITGYIGDDVFEQFYPWASNLSSMFFLQEYFAVKYLRDQGIIPGDAVFIPGHSGDFLGGSQFAKHKLPVGEETTGALASRILEVKYHFERYSKSERSLLLKRITEQLEQKQLFERNHTKAGVTGQLLQKQMPGQSFLPGGITDKLQQQQVSGQESTTPRSWSVHEDWDLKEKLAKFNVNSSATYTFFGYDFRLPYYDRELVNFFRDVPVEVKRNKSLYDDLLINEYFIPEGVHFDAELHTSDLAYAMARFRARIKRILPKWILALRRRKADVLFYREITAQLREDLVTRGGRPAAYGSRYNKMIIDWYLFTLHEKIST